MKIIFHLRRTPVRVAACVVAASVGFAGCGGTGGDGANNASAGGNGSAVIFDECGDGGCDSDAVVRYAYSTLPSTLVPYRSASALDIPFLFAAYDRLTYTDTKGTVQPMLAESWETPDDTTLVLAIRDDVTFHDGTSLDAEAVKVNLDNARGEESTLAGSLQDLESVEVTGDMEVTIKVASGVGALLTVLSDRPGIIVSPAKIGEESASLESESAGAGPYMLVENRAGDRLVYERFEDYWDPSVQNAAGLEYSSIPDDAARVRALGAGDVDIAALNEDSAPRVAGLDGVTLIEEPAPRSWFLAINRSKPGLDKVEVRRAMSQAVDRKSLSEGLLQGYCEPSVQLFQEGHPAHHPDLDDAELLYDPDGAKENLAAAGEENFAFTLDVPNIPSVTLLAEALQADWKNASIEVELNVVEVPELLERWAGGQSDAYLGGFLADLDPSTVFQNWYTADGSSNPSGEEPDGLSNLVAESKAAPSLDERIPYFQDIAELIVADAAPPTVLCTRYSLLGARDNLRNVQMFSHGQFDWRSVGVAND